MELWQRAERRLVGAAVLLVLVALIGMAGPAAAQPRRVAGVSVMVTDVQPAVGGRTVDFDVQLTTLSPQSTDCSECGPPIPGLRKRAAVVTGAPAPLASPPIGHLGDYVTTGTYNTTYTYGPYTYSTLTGTAPYNGGTNRYFSTYRYYTTLHYSSQYHVVGDGALPGIDYGDGQTVPATTLPTLVTSTTTVGGAVRRVFRGSFTHMYSDPSTPHTIRVASAPNPTGGTPFTGTSLTAAVYPFHASTQVTAHFGVSYRGTYGYRTVYHSPGSSSTTVNVRGPYTYGPSPVFSVNPTFSDSTTFTATGYPAQLVNSALVPGLSLLQIPTLSGWGLLLLAGLLASAGVLVLLRR